MGLSQKCSYALRAVFELAKADGGRATKIGEVADRQRIPLKFLEAILNELKRGGFVESRRGNDGGYMLARPPQRLTVGDIIRFVEGPLCPMTCDSRKVCGQRPETCVFMPVWKDAEKALTAVYDGVTFQDLLDRSAAHPGSDFSI